MEDLLLNPNFKLNTPIIYFKVNGELTIMGRSINENIVEYYQPALDWLMLLKEKPPATITLTINLEYFNTKSSMIILHFFKILEEIQSKKLSKVQVNWLYEEDNQDMLESGNDYQSIVKLPFALISLIES